MRARPARTVGMSLEECTAMSTAFASRASSISLVNRPLPPASDSGAILDAVAGGLDDMDFDRLGRAAMRRDQQVAHGMRLHQRQRRAARADP